MTIYIENALKFSLFEPDNVEYNVLRHMNIAYISFDFISNGNDRECMIICHKENLGKNYIKTWKSFAPGYFIPRDYRKNKRDSRNKTPYYVIKYIMNNIKMKALVRKMIELEDNTLDEIKKEELIKKYGDVQKDNTYYSVIKICPDIDTSWVTNPQNKITDIIYNPAPGDFYVRVYQDNLLASKQQKQNKKS